MSDEPEAYRPRRAWREEEPSAAEPATPDGGPTDSGPTDSPVGSDDVDPPAEAPDADSDAEVDPDADGRPDDARRRGHRCGRSRRRTASAVPGRFDGGPLAPVRRRRGRGPRALRRDHHLESSPGAQTEPVGARSGRDHVAAPHRGWRPDSPARRRRGRRRPGVRPVGRPSPTAAADRCGRRGRHPRTRRRVRDHQDHRPADRSAGALHQRRSDRSRGHTERRELGPRHGPDHRRDDALRGPGRDDRQEAHLEGRTDPARHDGGLTPPPRLSRDRRHRRSPASSADGAPAAQQQRLRLTGGAAPGDVVRQPGGGRSGVRLRGSRPG